MNGLRSSLALAALALAACGPDEVALQSGHYIGTIGLDGTELDGAELDVRVDDLAATLVLADGTTLNLALAARDRADWRLECPTNYTSVRVETFDVTPAPLVAAGVTLSSPVLTAGCFESSPEAVLRGVAGDGADRTYAFMLHTVDF